VSYVENSLSKFMSSWTVSENKLTFHGKRIVSAMQALEHQISALRSELERLVDSGQSMTSPDVIAISMELDLKIIEFMGLKETLSPSLKEGRDSRGR